MLADAGPRCAAVSGTLQHAMSHGCKETDTIRHASYNGTWQTQVWL